MAEMDSPAYFQSLVALSSLKPLVRVSWLLLFVLELDHKLAVLTNMLYLLFNT